LVATAKAAQPFWSSGVTGWAFIMRIYRPGFRWTYRV